MEKGERREGTARKGVLNKKATRERDRVARRGGGREGTAGNAEGEDIATRRRRRKGEDGGKNDRWKKSRAARELSRSRCVEPHPSRPLPPSRISPLSPVSRSLFPADPVPLPYRRPRSFSLLPGQTHRRGARTPSLLSASTIVFCFIITAARLRSRRSPRIDDLLLQCRRNSPRSGGTRSGVKRRGAVRPVEGGLRRFIAINRRWPVVTSPVRARSWTHTSIVIPRPVRSGPVVALRNCEKIVCVSLLADRSTRRRRRRRRDGWLFSEIR